MIEFFSSRVVDGKFCFKVIDIDTDTDTDAEIDPTPLAETHTTPSSTSTSNPNKNENENPGPTLTFDPEWLAITRAFHPWLSTTRHQPAFPDEAEARALVAKELEWVRANVPKNERGEILVREWQSFVMTAPGPGMEGGDKFRQREFCIGIAFHP